MKQHTQAWVCSLALVVAGCTNANPDYLGAAGDENSIPTEGGSTSTGSNLGGVPSGNPPPTNGNGAMPLKDAGVSVSPTDAQIASPISDASNGNTDAASGQGGSMTMSTDGMSSPPTGGQNVTPSDRDRDGVPDTDDCKPDDPLINPDAQELCDGVDNDCDNKVDETFSFGQPCSSGVGACSAEGRSKCAPDGLSVVCDAVPLEPVEEQCDRIDNDCDGNTDESIANCCEPGAVQPCGTNQGLCEKGQQTCSQDGEFGECVGGVGPKEEQCNGLDDNCDGAIDEGFPELGAECEIKKGECRSAGINRCNAAGDGVTCDAEEPQGQDELCDGIDNDCDSRIDESFMRLGEPCVVEFDECVVESTYQCAENKAETICKAAEPERRREVCDGKDNDCDGQVDEDLADVCIQLIGRVDAPNQALRFGEEVASKGDMSGDGIADVVVSSGGQDRRMVGIIDGQSTQLRCRRFENGNFGQAFTVGNIVPGGGLEIAVARPNSNNPMVRLLDANCENIGGRSISGNFDNFRARGALSSIEGFNGFAVANPAAFGNSGSVRIYGYGEDGQDEIWSVFGSVVRRSIGNRAFLVPDVDGDDLPDLIATADQIGGGRGTNLYYSDSPLNPSGTLSPGNSNGTFGEDLVLGDLFDTGDTVFAFGAPGSVGGPGGNGGVFLVTADGGILNEQPLRRNQPGDNVARRLALFEQPETGINHLVVGGGFGRVELWRLALNQQGPSIRESHVIAPEMASPSFGRAVAFGEAGPDGTARLFISAPEEDERGRVYVYSIR